jgi:hypothetical protein
MMVNEVLGGKIDREERKLMVGRERGPVWTPSYTPSTAPLSWNLAESAHQRMFSVEPKGCC